MFRAEKNNQKAIIIMASTLHHVLTFLPFAISERVGPYDLVGREFQKYGTTMEMTLSNVSGWLEVRVPDLKSNAGWFRSRQALR